MLRVLARPAQCVAHLLGTLPTVTRKPSQACEAGEALNPDMPRILLGVSGGIAAYKALELVRLATGAGHAVRVIQTPASRASSAPRRSRR